MSEIRKQLAFTITESRKSMRRSCGKPWTQACLAKASGLTLGTIQKIEAEKTWPDWKSLEKIAQALKVSVDDFFLIQDSLSLDAALQKVNADLGINLQPGRQLPPTQKIDLDFFYCSLRDEISRVSDSLDEISKKELSSIVKRSKLV